jgi:hypothetical protein
MAYCSQWSGARLRKIGVRRGNLKHRAVVNPREITLRKGKIQVNLSSLWCEGPHFCHLDEVSVRGVSVYDVVLVSQIFRLALEGSEV